MPLRTWQKPAGAVATARHTRFCRRRSFFVASLASWRSISHFAAPMHFSLR